MTAAHRAPDPRSRLFPAALLRAGRHSPAPLLRAGRHTLHPLCAVQQAPQLVLSGLAAMIIAAIVGLVCFVVVAEHRRAPAVRQSSAQAAPPGLASRAVDPEPLTQREVFPAADIRPGPYRVAVTNRDRDCATAVGGELGPMLRDLGCSQVVRAAAVAPYGDYRVTLGIFDLPDADGAHAASEHAGALVDRGRNIFAALGAPPGQASWQPWGHYLLYCVVSRPDGGVVGDDDPHAPRIAVEVLEGYFVRTVLSERLTS